MRIELNAGGLGGMASIPSMQTDVSSLLSKSSSLLASFQGVKNFAYNMNGGVGSLENAVNQIESRISFEESRITALQEVNKKSNGFIELAIATDIKVGGLVNKNKNEFYNVNEWAKPPQNSNNKNLIERGIEWLSSAGKAISDTIGKIKDSICGFCKSIKEKMDELMSRFKAWWKDHMTVTPVIIEDEVYDSDNYILDGDLTNDYYGSRQHGPMKDVAAGDKEAIKIYTDIIKKNTGKELSTEELMIYLDAECEKDANGNVKRDQNGHRIVKKEGLNNEGCEYAAIVNTIFEYYIHRENGEQEFYNKFGYPLRDSKENLNYNIILVDMYSKYDDTSYKGLTDKKAEAILEAYMGEAGNDGKSSVNVDMKPGVRITVRNIDNYLNSGKQVIMSAQNVIIRDENGNLIQDCAGGGHAMVVTGVTEDGRYIVSTWGKKGYIDPKKQHLNTSMDFSTIEYK